MNVKSIPEMVRPAHPARAKLFAYAEQVSNGATIGESDVARHVAACDRCEAEVRGMIRSFDVVVALAPLEPSRRTTAGILLAARNERHQRELRAVRYRKVVRVSKGLSAAAAAVVIVNLAIEYDAPKSSFQPAVIPAGLSLPIQEAVPAAQTAAEVPEPSLRKTPAEKLLRDAVIFAPAQLRTGYEERTRRAMQALEADIHAASQELMRNPAMATRAKQVMMSSQRRLSEELRDYFAERPL
jgi:hypothetical protein